MSVGSRKRKIRLVRIEVAEAEVAHRSDRAQFRIRSEVFVPLILVFLVSKTD